MAMSSQKKKNTRRGWWSLLILIYSDPRWTRQWHPDRLVLLHNPATIGLNFGTGLSILERLLS